MSIDRRYRSSASLFYRSFPPGVKWLIVANVAIYILLLSFVDSMLQGKPILLSFNLVPLDVVRRGEIWQLVTYMFLHGSITHILFNMLTLWMFGTAIEQTWGTRRFLQYYFICGVGAGICVVLANILFGNPAERVIGASGAIYGLLLAFGMMFPDQEILLFLLFPMKAKYAVMIFGAIAFLGSFQGGTVSNLAHLGGMLVGYVYFRTRFSSRLSRSRYRSPSMPFSFSTWWKNYKLQRAKKKFQVYMKKHGPEKGPWVN
jgi:membrane associated rhomboid family serine protease